MSNRSISNNTLDLANGGFGISSNNASDIPSKNKVRSNYQIYAHTHISSGIVTASSVKSINITIKLVKCRNKARQQEKLTHV